MKASNSSVASFRSVRQVLHLLPAAALALGFTACYNFTSSPLCTAENAVEIPGMSGTYTLSVQNPETFVVETQEYVIEALGNHVSVASSTGENESSTTCQVSGRFISESYDEELGVYGQKQVNVTGLGLSFIPIMYNKQSLDAAAIPSKIVPVESINAKGWLKALAGSASRAIAKKSPLALIVDNDEVDPRTLITHAAVAPGALVFVRK